ncbi:hypothetical protein [Clostridium sp. Marseille-QA1073]
MKSFDNHKHGLLFKLTLGTGLSLEEVLALRWSDIKNNTLNINKCLRGHMRMAVVKSG